MLPTDPVMMLSFVNMKLRGQYASLDDLCDDLDVSKDEILSKLKRINYEYDETSNQFK